MIRATGIRLFVVTAFVCAAVVAEAQQAQAVCSFHLFQLPPSFDGTEPQGINRYGTVVGSGHSKVGQAAQAFIRYADGSVKTFALNGNLQTNFNKRNANGVTVGTFVAPSGKVHGLVYYNGSTREVDHPNATTYTALTGVNLYGSMVGYYLDANRNYQGFELKGGKFISIQYPGARWTFAENITDGGVIVGYYENNVAPYSHGFVLANGTYTTVDDPAGTGGGTVPLDMNGAGTIVGGYFPNENPRAFIFRDGVFKDVSVPGASFTSVGGINGYGVITGEAAINGVSKGYTATCQ